MSKLISISIDVTKLDKNKFHKGKNGTYANLDVWINDEPDKYGHDASVSIRQPKEERDAKERKVYVGNGKKIFGWDEQPAPKKETFPADPNEPDDDEQDEIPF